MTTYRNRRWLNRTITLAVFLTALLLPMPSFAQSTDLPAESYLPLDMALEMAMGALGQCEADGYRVSVAVVDRGGNLKVLLKADGAGPHTIGSSSGKAFTAASMGRSTQALAQAVASNPELVGLRYMDERMLILAGGLPIVVNDRVVGGIGVGGAPGGHLDEACAQVGIDTVLGTADAGMPEDDGGMTDAALWCQFAGTGATIVIDEQRANFTCDIDGEQEVVLLGDITLGDQGWMIDKASLTRQNDMFVAESVAPVQVTHIELADGTVCAWAGTGATMAFDEKRVNFTCDVADQEVVLVGDVIPSDQGWTIEKAVLAHGDDGFTVESSEMALIAALGVSE